MQKLMKQSSSFSGSVFVTGKTNMNVIHDADDWFGWGRSRQTLGPRKLSVSEIAFPAFWTRFIIHLVRFSFRTAQYLTSLYYVLQLLFQETYIPLLPPLTSPAPSPLTLDARTVDFFCSGVATTIVSVHVNVLGFWPSGRNRTCGPAIPVQRSNLLDRR